MGLCVHKPVFVRMFTPSCALGDGKYRSPQTSQCLCCNPTVSHHWLQCEISLAADFSPSFCPGSPEQIVIRENVLVLERSYMLSTFNFHLTLK